MSLFSCWAWAEQGCGSGEGQRAGSSALLPGEVRHVLLGKWQRGMLSPFPPRNLPGFPGVRVCVHHWEKMLGALCCSLPRSSEQRCLKPALLLNWNTGACEQSPIASPGVAGFAVGVLGWLPCYLRAALRAAGPRCAVSPQQAPLQEEHVCLPLLRAKVWAERWRQRRWHRRPAKEATGSRFMRCLQK